MKVVEELMNDAIKKMCLEFTVTLMNNKITY